MTPEQLLQISQYFAAAAGKDDGDLINMLMEAGHPREFAERLVAFLPIAFGRVVIAHIGEMDLSDEYLVTETNSRHSLLNEPVYTSALAFATGAYQSGILSRDCFSAVATRSAELSAVNRALNKGADLHGASMGPVVLFGYETFGREGWLKRALRWFGSRQG